MTALASSLRLWALRRAARPSLRTNTDAKVTLVVGASLIVASTALIYFFAATDLLRGLVSLASALVSVIVALARALVLALPGALGVLFVIGGIVELSAQYLRRVHTNDRMYLDSIKHDRRAREAEAARIVRAWEACQRKPISPHSRPILRCTIHWEVWEADEEGHRLLVKPLFDDRLAALVGRDPKTERAFFMAVPAWVARVADAMGWLYDLPGFFNKGEIHEV